MKSELTAKARVDAEAEAAKAAVRRVDAEAEAAKAEVRWLMGELEATKSELAAWQKGEGKGADEAWAQVEKMKKLVADVRRALEHQMELNVEQRSALVSTALSSLKQLGQHLSHTLTGLRAVGPGSPVLAAKSLTRVHSLPMLEGQAAPRHAQRFASTTPATAWGLFDGDSGLMDARSADAARVDAEVTTLDVLRGYRRRMDEYDSVKLPHARTRPYATRVRSNRDAALAARHLARVAERAMISADESRMSRVCRSNSLPSAQLSSTL